MLRYFLIFSFFAVLFIPQVFAESYQYDYALGSLKFDTNLNGLTCNVSANPTINTARSLDIDGMDDYFFIIVGKTNFGEYHYLQIQLPDNNGKEHRESYLLDFKMQNQTIVGGLYQDYPQLAKYLETDSKSYPIDSANYKRFLVGTSLNVSPSSESLGPGHYNFHAILFQSDRVNWIKDNVCAISLNWPVIIDVNGNITTDNPQTQIGRIYPVETNKDVLAETDKITNQSDNKNENSVHLDETLHVNSKTITEDKPIHISPKKQTKSGIQPDEIICKEGLELVIKTDHRHQPICLTPDTKSKMIHRGLAIPVQIVN